MNERWAWLLVRPAGIFLAVTCLFFLGMTIWRVSIEQYLGGGLSFAVLMFILLQSHLGLKRRFAALQSTWIAEDWTEARRHWMENLRNKWRISGLIFGAGNLVLGLGVLPFASESSPFFIWLGGLLLALTLIVVISSRD